MIKSFSCEAVGSSTKETRTKCQKASVVPNEEEPQQPNASNDEK